MLRCVVGLTFWPEEGPGLGQAGLRNMASENRASFTPYWTDKLIETSFKGDSPMKIVAESLFFKEVK